MNENLKASCHCQRVQIEIPELPETITRCTCSICRRYGAWWAYFTRDQIRFAAGEADSVPYSWGDRSIAFFHCRHCGCLTHYESLEDSDTRRFAVNSRMLPADAVSGIPLRTFDGADTWTFLD